MAIDGPAGAGKSTLARRIAAKLGFVYIDTGAMYRAVALWALRANVALSDMHRLEQLANAAHIEFVPGDSVILLNGEDVTEAIRRPEVSQAASEVSLVPAVRRALVEKQRELGQQDLRGDGRPRHRHRRFPGCARSRSFSTPSPRSAQRGAPKKHALPSDVGGATDLAERDQRDRARAESPLVQAPDAVYVDTTGRTIDEVEAAIVQDHPRPHVQRPRANALK